MILGNWTRVLLLSLGIIYSQGSFGQSYCGSAGRGAMDYNDHRYHLGGGQGAAGKLAAVERRHFTPKVEQLISGESTSVLLADLDYTLSMFPNHHRALLALSRYDLKLNGRLPRIDKPYPQTVECYFQRALDFRPNDPGTLQIFGMHHHMNGRYREAIAAYSRAESLMKSPELDYNMGLSYLELKEYDKAREYAIKAYSAGYPLPGLKNRLARQGVTLE